MTTLSFRTPAEPIDLLGLLQRAWPAMTMDALQRLLRDERVSADGRALRRVRNPRPGVVVEVTDVAERPGATAEMLEILSASPHAAVLAERGFEPGMFHELCALVPVPAWPKGSLRGEVGGQESSLDYEVRGAQDGVAELAVWPRFGAVCAPRILMARAGFPVLGDALNGGSLVSGGLRLALCRAGASEEDSLEFPVPDSFITHEPIFLPDASRGGEPLLVSAATQRAIKRGHPWVLRDRELPDLGGFRPGALIALQRQSGPVFALARVEGDPMSATDGPEILARVWAVGVERPRAAKSVEVRVHEALKRREALFAQWADVESGSNAFRLIHGEADGLPGLVADLYGSVIRIVLRSRACEELLPRVAVALGEGLQSKLGIVPAIIEVIHLRRRPTGSVCCVRVASRGEACEAFEAGAPLEVRENGLRFETELGLAEPDRPRPGVGLFLDQRENRARLVRQLRAAPLREGRWLNLFAHTGAFSVALLAAGAREVISVDLSRPYLDTLKKNLALNELDASSSIEVQGDVRRYLEKLPEGETFQGIILDPPTAAAAGHRFWSLRKDGGSVLESVLRHLAPGGVLLLCRNDRKGRGDLAKRLEQAAEQAGVALEWVKAAPAGVDFPSLKGFSEGDPFEGVLARRAEA